MLESGWQMAAAAGCVEPRALEMSIMFAQHVPVGVVFLQGAHHCSCKQVEAAQVEYIRTRVSAVDPRVRAISSDFWRSWI